MITAIVAYGARESATVNLIFKGTNILLIIIILCLSFPHADKHNWSDFFHYGDTGIFAAAATVFFAYNGARTARHTRALMLSSASTSCSAAVLGS